MIDSVEVGQQLGRYRLDELIGVGGMGEVYRAFDTVRRRTVALKLLPRSVAADSEFEARFRRESALAAQLHDPHVIPIHDYGEVDGQLFIDMRLVDGTDLGQLLNRGALPPVRAEHILSQVADALDAAHREGLVHRDVKPSNVLLAGTGTVPDSSRDYVYLVDFGVARTLLGAGATRLTRTGITVGTLAYIAPERLLNQDSDHRADVYALACVLYEMLTGDPPYEGDTAALVHAHTELPPPRPSTARPELPAGIDDVIARGMDKDPARRYPSAGAFAAAAQAALIPVEHSPPATVQPAPPIPRAVPPNADGPGAVRPPVTSVPRPTPKPAWTPETRSNPRTPRTPLRPNTRPQARRRPPVAAVVAAVAVLAVLSVVAVIVVNRNQTPPPAPPPQAAATPLAKIPVADQPASVELTPDGRRGYVIHYGKITVIDTAAFGAAATVAVDNPTDVAVSPDGRRAYVTAADRIDVIDTGTNTVTGKIPLERVPYNLAITGDGRLLYVSNEPDDTITVVDVDANAVSATIQVGDLPTVIAFTPDGRNAYVVNLDADSVSVISRSDNSVIATIPVGDRPHDIAITADGRRAYTVNSDSGTMSLIDTSSNTVVDTIPVGDDPGGIAITPDDRYACVASPDSDEIFMMDLATRTVIGRSGTGDRPGDVKVSPDGLRAYTADGGSDTVSVIDIGSLQRR